MHALTDVWDKIRNEGFGPELTDDAATILKRMFFTGASTALAMHGIIEVSSQEMVRHSLHTLEEEISETLDGGK